MSRKANVPGPGSYTERGKNVAFILSTIKNSGCPIIRKSSNDRFTTARASCFTPGPGNYTLKDDIGKGGHYILSKYHNANGAKFGYKLDDNTIK